MDLKAWRITVTEEFHVLNFEALKKERVKHGETW